MDPSEQARVSAFVDRAFERLSEQLLSGRPGPPTESLVGIFREAAGERSPHSIRLLRPYLASLQHHLDAQRSAAKASITRALVDPQPEQALQSAQRQIAGAIERVVETESTALRNAGSLVAIGRKAEAGGIEDPTVVFISRPDCCPECARLHRTPAGEPRAWLQSELGTSYHRRGDDYPKIGGCHPMCRCSLVMVPPGYGYKNGKLGYVSAEYSLLADQRS